MTHARLMFPHPVLRPEGIDYAKDCSFEVELAVQSRDSRIQLRIKHTLASDFLAGLIRDQSAGYLAVIKCKKTGQRLARKTGQEDTWDLDAGDFRGNLLFSAYVVAEREIEPFKSDEHDSEIRGMVRSVPAGSILAMSGQSSITLDKTEGSVKAAIHLVHSDQIPDGRYAIVLERDLIEIVMSRKTLAETKRLRRRFSHILLPALYVPAIEAAIRGLRDHRDLLWAGAVRDALEKHDFDADNVEDANYAAQKLMNDPYQHMLGLLKEEDQDD